MKTSVTSYHWQKVIRPHILKRDGYKCVKCGRIAREVDHRRPRWKGGTNEYTNLQSLCKQCHWEKTQEDIKELKYLFENDGTCEHGFRIEECKKCS